MEDRNRGAPSGCDTRLAFGDVKRAPLLHQIAVMTPRDNVRLLTIQIIRLLENTASVGRGGARGGLAVRC